MLETLIFTGTCGKSWLRLVEHVAPLSADTALSDILHSGAGPFLLQQPIDSFSQSLLARDELRMVVLFNPTVHCTEMFRAGYFGPEHEWYYSVGYVVSFNMVLMLIALIRVRHVSKTLTLE
jgi:ABC-type polysaccharide/polyol phosphate export permease